MFTIKHITPMGNEALHLAHEVHYTPAAEPRTQGPGFGALIGTVFYAPDAKANHFLELHSGNVFVMNEGGATVSKWDLGGWAEPSQ